MVDDQIAGNKEAAFISAASYESINGDNGTLDEKVKILHKITVAVENGRSAKNVNVTKEPFNILITGIDVAGNIDTVSRSDVNMIATVNPKTKKVLLYSWISYQRYS
jgi:anionic cell wall polymer biosynthesis LytR-Cps2A-Psr (LCP) family protein